MLTKSSLYVRSCANGSHLIPTTASDSTHCLFLDERAEAPSTGLVKITQEPGMKLGFITMCVYPELAFL